GDAWLRRFGDVFFVLRGDIRLQLKVKSVGDLLISVSADEIPVFVVDERLDGGERVIAPLVLWEREHWPGLGAAGSPCPHIFEPEKSVGPIRELDAQCR